MCENIVDCDERERERERQRAMIINKANKSVKEISLFWEYANKCGEVKLAIRNYPSF